MTVVKHETFGPVSPVIRFKNIDEAIRISNGTAYGLVVGGLHQPARTTSRASSRELERGHASTCARCRATGSELTPFGGIKDSGLGYKEGVLEAMKSFTNTKTYSLPW